VPGRSEPENGPQAAPNLKKGGSAVNKARKWAICLVFFEKIQKYSEIFKDLCRKFAYLGSY
jgi:hypothetical protein